MQLQGEEIDADHNVTENLTGVDRGDGLENSSGLPNSDPWSGGGEGEDSRGMKGLSGNGAIVVRCIGDRVGNSSRLITVLCRAVVKGHLCATGVRLGRRWGSGRGTQVDNGVIRGILILRG